MQRRRLNTSVPNSYYNDGIDVNRQPGLRGGFGAPSADRTGVHLERWLQRAGLRGPRSSRSSSLGSTSIGVFAWTPRDQVDFWGVASSQAFNRMEIRDRGTTIKRVLRPVLHQRPCTRA